MRATNQNGPRCGEGGQLPWKVVPWIAETKFNTVCWIFHHHHTMIFILLKIYRSWFDLKCQSRS
jgi:hypothetical protein